MLAALRLCRCGAAAFPFHSPHLDGERAPDANENTTTPATTTKKWKADEARERKKLEMERSRNSNDCRDTHVLCNENDISTKPRRVSAD